jgi:hypothetical protein
MDEDVENYLRHVVHEGPGKGTGAVPSAFPSTFFEHSWVLSTLLKSGYASIASHSETVQQLAASLQSVLANNDGTIGFGNLYFPMQNKIPTADFRIPAPSVGSDADDTAVTILLLNLLGKPTNSKKMVKMFGGKTSFITYPEERVPSFSTNYNVLLTLLASPDRAKHAAQITITARFLYTHWFESKDPIKDKWVSI